MVLAGDRARFRQWLVILIVGRHDHMRISEVISKMSATGDSRDAAQVEGMFPEAVFGLLMNGLPEAKHGQKYVVDGSGSVTIQPVMDPSGRGERHEHI